MKKLGFILSVTALAVSITACGNKTSNTSMVNDNALATMSPSVTASSDANVGSTDNSFSDHNGNGITDSGTADMTNNNDNMGNSVGNAVDNAANDAGQMAGDAIGMAGNGIDAAANGVGGAVKDAADGVGNAARGVIDAGENMADDVMGMNLNDDSDYYGTLGDLDGDGFIENYR